MTTATQPITYSVDGMTRKYGLSMFPAAGEEPGELLSGWIRFSTGEEHPLVFPFHNTTKINQWSVSAAIGVFCYNSRLALPDANELRQLVEENLGS